ncbi:hypothetical protein DICVIV_11486 [Dictyocaulus viviparus]|uniref:Uncharacterized protein n=1 Tax=Dictyocaulus viviparus TaxID=29172 RepID=A0A0D8XFL7_DICVI|nr:hypothetical protein DICVIV_11486 [Dictyocaulus viviparus]
MSAILLAKLDRPPSIMQAVVKLASWDLINSALVNVRKKFLDLVTHQFVLYSKEQNIVRQRIEKVSSFDEIIKYRNISHYYDY